MDDFLLSAATYLAAAVVSVPIAQRLGLGSVLGYLISGLIVGPYVLGLVPAADGVIQVAQFGVVMMLFLAGLELQPEKLWAMRTAAFGLGTLQVVSTTLLVFAAAFTLGMPAPAALAIGMIVTMSSTAIVLQALNENGLLRTPAGETTFAITLFHDIAVIPILVILPLLATGGAAAEAMPSTPIDHLPGWAAAIAVLAAVALIIAVGRLVMRPLFRLMARSGMREIFTATALLLLVGTALLMQAVGLSAALGAFLAGVVLADSEFRHEITTDVEPFKGLLLGLFFISVGAGIDIPVVLAQPVVVAAVVVGLVAAKIAVQFVIARAFRFRAREALVIALTLSQVGEFAFVLIAFAGQTSVLDGAAGSLLTAAVALSMLTTPLLLMAFDRLSWGREDTGPAREPDVVDERNRVIIAGFGRMGQIVGRLLIGRGIPVTVLEHDAEQLEALRRFGFTLYYGDARRHDLLAAAGAGEAALLVVTTDDKDTTTGIVEMAKRNFPDLRIVARAFDRPHAYELEAAGADRIVRETFAGGIELGTEALKELGLPAYEAERSGRIFRRYDAETMSVLRELWTLERSAYSLAFRQRRDMLARVLSRDVQTMRATADAAWDSTSLREEVRDRVKAEAAAGDEARAE